MLAPPTLITTSGPFTMPATGNLFRIRVQGGGGGSGSARATSSTGLSTSGGGGAGAYVELWLTRAELQALITAGGGHLDIVIGAGGSGGYADASGNGGAGGTTQFGSAIICPGGYGSNYGAVASYTTTALELVGVQVLSLSSPFRDCLKAELFLKCQAHQVISVCPFSHQRWRGMVPIPR